MTEKEFSPTNSLEHALLDAQQGTGSPAAFFDQLLTSQVFVLLDKDIGPEGRWDPSINMCVLTNAAGGPFVAAFTAPERSTPWHEHLPQFGYGLLVSFTWLLQGLGSEVGVVINPGGSVGVELAPEAIGRLKQQVAGNSAAT
ncbi:SseB family protein [Pseudoxanthomonas sp. PXM02]|uniref:SseB family protein n=1 Tax=Pseudoxanthomonas sp. PXM02 TaxID=2769294 RepID=UPI001786CB0B|nr:SseB family protein [Pseudoxanthomonas sp. PXM02]MBD9480963.1 SseB family protein [Pseudoxanthomonas sp. PXM02]